MEMLLPLAVAMIVTSFAVRKQIPMMKKIRSTQQIYSLAPDSHKEKADTPTMGGIGIIFGVLIACVVTIPFIGFSSNLIVILAVFICFGAVGFLDDYTKVSKKSNLGLTAKQKLIYQIMVAFAVALYYVYMSGMGTDILIPFVWKHFDIGYWMIPYIVFIIVAMTNAVNLTDGLDGLAGGITASVSLFWPVIAILGTILGFGTISEHSHADTLLYYTKDAVFFVALAGACLGFLLYNRYPAKIFMGDTGSLAIGGGIAAAAVFTKMEWLLPVVGFVFVLEALSVIIQVVSYKLRKGKRVFKMAPLHHHYELSGWKEQKVVSVFITVTVILCVLSIGVMLIQVFVLHDSSPPQASFAPGNAPE